MVIIVDFKQIGGVLRAQRKKLGKNLEQMADELKVGVSTLSSIERGIHNVSKEKWLAYANALGMGSLLGVVDEVEEQIVYLRRKMKNIEEIAAANPKQALQQLNELNKTEKVESMGVLRPMVHFLRGKCYFTQKDWERADKYFHYSIESMEKFPELDETNVKADCYNYLSFIKHFHGEYQDALKLVQIGLMHFVDNGNRDDLKALLLLNQSIYLDHLGAYEKVLNTIEELNDFIHQHNYQIEVRTSVIIQMYIIQSNVLIKLNMLEKALECAKKGEKIAWINQDFSRLFSLWAQIGSIYLQMQDLVLAEEYLLKSLDLQAKITKSNLLLFAYKNYAALSILKKEWALANDIVDRLLKIGETQQDKRDVVVSLLRVGEYYQANGRYVEAIELYLRVEEMVNESKLDSYRYEIITGLWFCYGQMKDKAKFQHYMEQMYQLQQVKNEHYSINFVDSLSVDL